ncbi:mCG1048536 [Mus musculus]|nr:mCG1048536 [Mus musculus]
MSDMELQSFVQMTFGLAFVQDFLTRTFWSGKVQPVMLELQKLPLPCDSLKYRFLFQLHTTYSLLGRGTLN